ncbi:hypothetical protein ECZU28_06300 [Escherichia coli]|nr:hypothetical protein ECZU28_06300 [Escherichia coli]
MSGKPAARQGDMTRKGLDIVQGSAGVLIGAPTGLPARCVLKRTVKLWQPGEPGAGCKGAAGRDGHALPGPLPFILSRAYSSYRTRRPRR